MAMCSVCPKCNRQNRFETAFLVPEKSAFRLIAVRCALCGVIIGIVEDFNRDGSLDDYLNNMNKRMETIEKLLLNIDNQLNNTK